MIYLDTSLVVSLYSADANSAQAASLLQALHDQILITNLVELEAVNALGLREFRKEITRSHAVASLQDFEADLQAGIFLLRAIPETAFARARKLSRQTTPQLGTRTADLLHVAAALELGATGFFSFDLQQKKAAQAAGLTVNPV